MNCHLLRSQLIELARGRLSDSIERDRVMAHVKICPSCSLLMEEQLGLTAAFEEFAARLDTAPPANLESIVLSEFALHRAFHRRRLKAVAMIGTMAGMLVGLAAIPRAFMTQPPSRVQTAAAISPVFSPVTRTTGPPTQEPVSKPVRRRAAKPAADAGPFVNIPYTLPLDPRERAVVMRMEMPVTALAAVGLVVAVPDPRASAQTDVIVGEDGRIRAIRLLSISHSNTDRSFNP